MDFMDTEIGDMLRNAQKLDETEAWIFSVTERMKQDILKYIRQDQLINKGVNEFGQIIGRYSMATQQITGGRKKAGDPYNLKDTGRFHESMRIELSENALTIDADAQKENTNLFRKYGVGIIGLTEDNLGKVMEEIEINLKEYILQVLLRD